jgi:hypothetical protein
VRIRWEFLVLPGYGGREMEISATRSSALGKLETLSGASQVDPLMPVLYIVVSPV